MRCHICNAQLSPAEIQWNNDHKDWDPCTTCQEVIDGVFNDSTDEEITEEIDYELEVTYGLYGDRDEMAEEGGNGDDGED